MARHVLAMEIDYILKLYMYELLNQAILPTPLCIGAEWMGNHLCTNQNCCVPHLFNKIIIRYQSYAVFKL